jgi:5-methylcytosine-specific restriction endonuclease McrA
VRLQTCSSCGKPFERRVRWHAKCPACEPRGVDQRSPTTRAQDSDYAAERARVLAPGPDARPPACVLRICCNGAPATTVDHVTPVARGGGHRGNLVPACAACNASKQDSVTEAASSVRGGGGWVKPVAPPEQARRPRGLPTSTRLA